MLGSQLFLAVFEIWYVHIATGNLQAYPNVGETLARINYTKLYLGYYVSVLSTLAMSHFLTQIGRSRKVSGAIRGMIIMNVISLLISLCQQLIFQAGNNETFKRIYAENAQYLTLGMLVINLILLCRMVKGLTDEFKVGKQLWILPAARILVCLINLFFYSQSLLMVATVIEEVVYLIVTVWGLAVLRKIGY